METPKSTKPIISRGEVIEARQALFFISAVLIIFSIYPLVTSGLTVGIASNIIFAISAFGLGKWSKTSPEQAFKIGFSISLFFAILGFFTGGIFVTAAIGAFSLAFYRGWKYAKLQNAEAEVSDRDDILDDGV